MHARSFHLSRWVLGALAPALIFAAGCGPIAFQGSTSKVIYSTPAEPPPAPVKAEPPPKPKRVEITKDSIVINEKVMFELNKAVIQSESHSLLNEVAETINEHAEIKKVRVEGHASKDGDDKKNMTLSKKRAKAVMDYLVEKGKVDAARLVSEGYGETQPLDPGDSEEALEKNRRVEFKILEQDPIKETKEVTN